MMGKQIGPWPQGMDVLSPDTDMPKDQRGNIIAARDSFNGDFSRTGQWQTRPGVQLYLSRPGMHSIWTSPNGRILAADVDQLVEVDANGVRVLEDLASPLPVDFTMLNDEIVFSTMDEIGIVGEDNTRPLGPPDMTTPIVSAAPNGGLFAGRYTVAACWLDDDGREGALSRMVTVDVPAGGGIRVVLAGEGLRARVYRSEANGTQIYRMTDVLPQAITSYTFGVGDLGEQADTAYLRRTLPGTFVRLWRGRLLTARGNILFLSEPMRYNLYSPRHGFVMLPAEITFLEAVEGGVWIGQPDTVKFLAGPRPGEWELKTPGGNAPMARSSMIVSSDLFDPNLQLVDGDHALWLASNGYVLGTPSGTLVEPQAQRIRLPVSAAGRTAVFDRRILTITTQ